MRRAATISLLVGIAKEVKQGELAPLTAGLDQLTVGIDQLAAADDDRAACSARGPVARLRASAR